METELKTLYEHIKEGDMFETADSVQAALDAGIAPQKILNEGMINAMSEVGRLFEAGEFFVPEMLVSARAMQSGLAVLRPHLINTGVKPIGKVAIGTVQGDLHDIGKNLVGMMMEGAGFEIVDLGVDVSPNDFVKAIQEQNVQIVAMSALLTTTMSNMRSTVDAIRDAGVIDQVKIMVGGAPVTAEFAESVGAHGFAADASQAATLAKSYVA